MNSLFFSTLTKLIFPAVAVCVVLFASRKRGLSWREDLGLQQPKPFVLVGWLVLWIVWISASEILIRVFGLDQAKTWPTYPAVILALRILAIGIVGPFAEEIAMRGIILHLLRRTVVGVFGAIAITAIGWAAMHMSYGSGTLVLVTADGVLLGLARYRSGSLWVPVAMHVLGNLISICQSLTS